MRTYFVKQGDTGPPIRATLTDKNGVVNLTGAAVRFLMSSSGGAPIVDEPATILTPLAGLVQYSWVAGDTDLPGMYQAEFQVTFGGGAVHTFPNAEYIPIQVLRQAG